MRRRILLLAALALLPLTCRTATLVVIERLAPGGGGAADGGQFTSDQPALDIVVRMRSDATDFNVGDLMRVVVNSVDRTAETVMGGEYAILRIATPPLGVPQFVELYTRTGVETTDTGTWIAEPYTGPTLAGVSPDEAHEGVPVSITGTGFSGGAVRVFFGGVEALAPGVGSDTQITATVPAGAQPGLVWVLVGNEAADGVVGFQPLDANDQPVPLATGIQFHAVFPASGGIEAPLRIYGLNFTQDSRLSFNDRDWSRVLDIQTVDVPPVGEITVAYGVVGLETAPASGDLTITESRVAYNPLPFEVTPN